MDIKKLDKKLDRKALKPFFVKNAIPTQRNFEDLIDGMINQRDDGIVKLPDEPLSLQADGNATSQKKVINFYGSFTDPKPAWTLSLNPYVDPNNPATARPGWNIGDADGNSRLFIDQNTGNVGVGTLDPKAKLDVSGGINMAADGVLYSPGRMHIHGDEMLFLLHKQGVVIGKEGGGNGNLIVQGSVGIGTPGPSYKLSISLQNQGDGILLDSGSNGKAVALFTNNTQGAWNGLTQPGDHLLLWKGKDIDDPGAGLVIAPWRNSASGIRIDANGNVGVGTSDPKYSFEIKASSGIKLGVEGSGGGQLIILNNKDDNRIYLEAFSSDGTGSASELLLTGIGGSKVPQLSFHADLTGVNGNFWVNGNVGIGTSDPKAKLDVSGMARIASVQNADKDPESGMTYGGSLVIKSNQPQIDFIDTEHNDWSIHVNSNKMYFIRQPWIYSDLVLDGAGSVGIGTDTPKGKLEVNGVTVISDGNCVAAALGYMAPGSLTVGGINTSYGGGQGWTSNTAGLLFETAANTEIAVHDSATRVASLMYYEGDAANRITIGRDMGWGRISQVVFAGAITPAMGNSSTAGIQFPADPGGGAGDTAWIRYYPRQGESCTLELGVSNDADDHIALMSSGNVGIGTSDPKAKLDVMGDIAIQNQHAFRGNDAWLRLNQDGAFSAGVHTPGLFAPSSLNVGGLSSWGNPGGGNVWIAGNVGIGTSDPKANLDVNGTLRARAMRVDIHNVSAEGFTLSSSNQWGDFNNLGLSLVLTQDTDVTVSYGISMTCRIGDNFERQHLVTRLCLDGSELPDSRCITGNTTYWSASSLWMGSLPAGSHTFKVQYRTPSINPVFDPNEDHQKGTLMVMLYGVG